MNLSPAAQRGQILLEQRRYPEAEKFFRDSLAQEPQDADALYCLAICEANQDRPKLALETIGRAIALEPEVAALHAFRALVLVDLKRSSDAEKSAAEALRLDPDSDFAWTSQAAVHLSLNEWVKGEQAARKALELNTDNPTAANQLAHALRLQNRLGESAEQTAFMLDQNPENPHTRVTAGWTDLQRGDFRSAEAHFLEALRLDASNEAAREGLKEAFRARSPFYRAYLSYSFFLQRFTAGKQWLIIIGLIFAVKFARILLPAPVAMVVVVLYFLFVLWAHVAVAVGNLLLCFDRFARHALNLGEKIEAWVVGGGVVAGLPLFLGGILAGLPVLLTAGLTLIGAAFPFAYTFTNKAPVGHWLFGAAGVFVLATGAVNGAAFAGFLEDSSLATGMGGLAFLLVMIVTWLANVRALNRKS